MHFAVAVDVWERLLSISTGTPMPGSGSSRPWCCTTRSQISWGRPNASPAWARLLSVITTPMPGKVRAGHSVVRGGHESARGANCIHGLGKIALRQNEYPNVRQQVEQAMALYDEVANRRGKAHGIHNLGETALGQSEYADARQGFEQAMVLYDQVSDHIGRPIVSANCARLPTGWRNEW